MSMEHPAQAACGFWPWFLALMGLGLGLLFEAVLHLIAAWRGVKL